MSLSEHKNIEYTCLDDIYDELINNFLIIDSEHNNFQIQEQKAKANK